ncbi:MAG: MerR family transcriptional regulator [Actinomycetaceae bacterium]|nr:MerR family transcriptional regulator [Actinomycetaceae bacterium]
MARRDAVVLTVSAAAELAGMHPQTVRQYDRLGLVEAKRTRGGGRRYSLNDVERLLEIQRLSQEEGVNLAGIARILELRDRNDRLRRHNALLERRLAELRERLEQERFLRERVFAAGTDGDIVVLSRSTLRPHLRVSGGEAATAQNAALVLWRPPAAQRQTSGSGIVVEGAGLAEDSGLAGASGLTEDSGLAGD